MSEALPLALFAVLVLLLAAMPWHRPHPNHRLMLELLRTQLEDEQAATHDVPVANVERREPPPTRQSSQVVKNLIYTRNPDDVAALAVHIMTNTALTGAAYDIDGGQQLVAA